MENEKELLDMRKKGKILVKIYEALRSTGAQPARFYGLAKINKRKPLGDLFSLSRKLLP